MDIREFYEVTGGDYEDAISRLMNEDFMRKFVLKFKDDASYKQMKEAIANHDIEQSFAGAHTLKGVAANLGFTKLYQVGSALTEQLRSQTEEADPALVAEVDAAYQMVVENIDKL